MAPTYHDPAERGYLRLFYRDWHPTRLGKLVTRALAWASGLGLTPQVLLTLQVGGRRSGRLHDTVLVVAKHDGQPYLVSMLGDGSEWVRNVRAAGGKAFVKRGQSRPVQLTEVPAVERGPILKAYCQVATSGRQHFPVSHNAPLSEFDAVAERYPELEDYFCILLSQIQPTAELLAKLPAIAVRTWETRKEQIAENAKPLTRRLEVQRALNLRTIKSKIDGHLSDEGFQTMKTSIAEETARIEETIKSLDAEKSSYTDLMQQAEAEVINFEQAWREGGIHRKRELQNALFPEGLTWWIKRKVFETGKGLSIDDLGKVFDTLGLVGVPDGI